jgi:AcrR family transcriptional regulator
MTSIIEDSASETGLRERKKQQTRRAIHEAALHLIDEHGLEATTIEQICHAADVSTRTFFNYYPSKAAAALELAGNGIEQEVVDRFRSASGSLVTALCDAIGGSAELGPSHATMKQLVVRRPELLPSMTQIVLEVRGKFVALAAERASTPEQAELAVTLVLAALGRVMRDNSGSDVPLPQRLRETVDLFVGVSGEPLGPVVPHP